MPAKNVACFGDWYHAQAETGCLAIRMNAGDATANYEKIGRVC
jgi:hypothetical protein